jgi:excisionase family DNA binding protein
MHPSTVRKWANDGLLQGTRFGRRQWRFRRSALRTLENARPLPGAAASADRHERGVLDPRALTSDDDLIAPDER